MGIEEDKKLMEKEIASLNEQIKKFGNDLNRVLNIDCDLGVCVYDPRVDNIREKIKEVQEKKELIERLLKNIASHSKDS